VDACRTKQEFVMLLKVRLVVVENDVNVMMMIEEKNLMLQEQWLSVEVVLVEYWMMIETEIVVQMDVEID
jgi:hypothetical protein